MSKKSYHHGNLRNALISAGVAILSSEGASAVSLRKVAREAGVSHAAPYRHFADKEALMVAIAEEGFHKLAQELEKAFVRFPTHPNDSFGELVEMSMVYLRFAEKNPDHLRVMFGGAVDKHVHPSLIAASEEAFSLLVKIIQIMQDKKMLRAGSADALALGLWSMLHGVTTLLIEDKIPPPIQEAHSLEEIAQTCVRVLYDGISS